MIISILVKGFLWKNLLISLQKFSIPKQCTIQIRKCINIHDIQMLCDLKWNFWYLTYYDLFTLIHNYLKFKGFQQMFYVGTKLCHIFIAQFLYKSV